MEWQENQKAVLLAASLGFLSYLLILFAFRIENVSYIVALRQLSVVFDVILGCYVLNEKYGKVRMVASAIMLIGFFLVAMA